jgi:hypothetical protein
MKTNARVVASGLVGTGTSIRADLVGYGQWRALLRGTNPLPHFALFRIRQPRCRFLTDNWKVVFLHIRCCLLTTSVAAALGPTATAQQSSAPRVTPPLSDTLLSPAPPGSSAYFVNLHDGDIVTSPFKVVFGLSPTMILGRSGIDKPNTGHHHLLVDTTLAPEEMAQPIRVDEQHIHFGKGQSETIVALRPGKHTLQLVFGDWAHALFNPSVQSAVITINVVSAKSRAMTISPSRSKRWRASGMNQP